MSISDLYNLRSSNITSRESSLLSLPTPSSSTGITSRLCNLCYANRAAYTCPNCNVPYCSLSCFRSEGHRECSTKFSVATLKSELAPEEKNADEEERNKVMDILRRLQDPTLPDEDEDEDDGGDEDGDGEGPINETDVNLEDIDTLPPDELLALLTPAERRRFELAIADPVQAQQLMEKLERKAAAVSLSTSSIEPPASSASDMTPSSLIQQRSTQPEDSASSPPSSGMSIWQDTPWWETATLTPCPISLLERKDPFDTFAASIRKILVSAALPASSASSSTSRARVPAPNLSHNLLAVLLAYVYILRHLNITSLSFLLLPDLASLPSKPTAPQSSSKHQMTTRLSKVTAAEDDNQSDDRDDEMPPLEPDTPYTMPARPASPQLPPSTPEPPPPPPSSPSVPNANSWQHRETALAAFELLDQLVPFLTILPPPPSPTSTRHPAAGSNPPAAATTGLAHGGLDLRRLILDSSQGAALFVLTRLRHDQAGNNAAKLLLRLLQDVQALLQQERVVSESDPVPRYRFASTIEPESARFDAYRQSLALNATWDIAHLLQRLPALLGSDFGPKTTIHKKAKGAEQKLAYYTCKTLLRGDRTAAVGMDTEVAADVEAEIQRLIIEIEGQERAASIAATANVLRGGDAASILSSR